MYINKDLRTNIIDIVSEYNIVCHDVALSEAQDKRDSDYLHAREMKRTLSSSIFTLEAILKNLGVRFRRDIDVFQLKGRPVCYQSVNVIFSN